MNDTFQVPTSWFSYDDVADHYASAAEPAYFTKPAEDLVTFLGPPCGARLLDVGAGSGAVAAAVRRAEPETVVVACDLSIPMLDVARHRIRNLPVVAAEISKLPFASAAYDATTLAFVLSHLPEPVFALHEVRRVLKATGKVAVSSWSSSAAATSAGEIWRRTSEEFVEGEEIDDAVAMAIPSEAALATDEGLRNILTTAGFADIVTRRIEYCVEIPIAQFIQSRLLAAPSRYLNARLDVTRWNDFVAVVSRRLTDRFGAHVSFEISVNMCVASPAG